MFNLSISILLLGFSSYWHQRHNELEKKENAQDCNSLRLSSLTLLGEKMRTISKVPFNPATNGIVINVCDSIRVRI